MSNGIKQKGVLSAILLTIYIDKLLCKLKRSRLGCRMGNSYVGALSHTNDITLLCPSIKGLNKMLDICNSFADMYDIKFNAKKSLVLNLVANKLCLKSYILVIVELNVLVM